MIIYTIHKFNSFLFLKFNFCVFFVHFPTSRALCLKPKKMNRFFSSILLLTLLISAVTAAGDGNDTAALLLFQSQTDIHGTLLHNWTLPVNSTTACTAQWLGVKCINNRVSAVILPSFNLRGPITALSSLPLLRLLDLRNNRLNGTLTPITQCTNLKLIYLSGNDFSGEIPPEISSLRRLLRLDVSNNNLEGSIPTQIANLTRLLTLRLQNNELSGTIPKSLNSLQNLKELNFSNNELYGSVPNGLYNHFGENSFDGNEGLCGIGNLPQCSYTGEIVPSNPSSLPTTSTATIEEPHEKSRKGLSRGGVVAIVMVNVVALLVVVSFMVAYYCGKYSRTQSFSMSGSECGKRRSSYSSEKRVYANNNGGDGGGGGDSDGTTATDRSKLVFFDRRKPFELEELLRASAEMLGKGCLGTVYKAVLDDGITVAVKRLKDANPCPRKEFEQYMDVIGKLKHPNMVKLRAYYYAKEEKLLVYDYLPNGSLHSLLHGKH